MKRFEGAVFAAAFTIGMLVSALGTRCAFAADTASTGTSAAEGDLHKAMDAFYTGLAQLFTGDAAPILKSWSHSPEVTDMGPFGNRSVGWTQVQTEFEREAKLKMGGAVEPRDMLVQVDGDLGYVVCVEHGHNLGPTGKAVDIDIRSTSIFRRENGEWKMVLHHTDVAPRLASATGAKYSD